VSTTKRSQEVAAAILRDFVTDSRPIVVGRAGQAACAPARQADGTAQAETGAAAAPAAAVNPTALPGYQAGFEAGVAAAEAAQRTREQASAEATQRAGFERGREDGRAQGLTEGREAGRQQAERDARAAHDAAEARLGRLDELLQGVSAELARRLEAAEDDMIALCHAAICRILGEEIVARDGAAQLVRQAVREGGFVGAASRLGQLAIHVHPTDCAALEGNAMLAAWLHQHSAAGVIRWVPDEQVKLGGCLVRSGEGTVDARLETQMTALQRMLAEGRKATKAIVESCAQPKAEAGEGRV
jgi:flagellar assembly protein FliH